MQRFNDEVGSVCHNVVLLPKSNKKLLINNKYSAGIKLIICVPSALARLAERNL
jgi:hypothetical protein